MSVPNDPEGRHFNANGQDITEYMIQAYATVYDAQGRITGEIREGRQFLRERMNRGETLWLGQAGFDFLKGGSDKYLDLSGKDPVLKTRPVITWGFDKNEIPTGQEAKIVRIPPCLVQFSGPLVGNQQHKTLGDLTIGFTTPGLYDILFEAFPYMPATFQLKVTQSGVVVAGKAVIS